MADLDSQTNRNSVPGSLSLGIGGINSANTALGSIFAPSSPILAFSTSIRQFVEVVDSLLTAQRTAIAVVESWAKQYQQLVEGMAKIASVIIPMLPATTPPAAVTESRKVLEGEIVEPKAIEVTYQPEILVSAFGIGLTVDGRFYDKVQSKDLAPLNIGSMAGKYLMLLITEDYYYLLDEKLYQEIPSVKYQGGKEQLRQDLRKILLKYNLDLATKRTTKQGTTLIGIKRL